MQIAYHIGAHCTDDDRLLASLRKNTETFAPMGIHIPGPGRYRNLVRETIQGLSGADPEPGTRDVLLNAIMQRSDSHRLVMSNPLFICVVKRIFENQLFYHLIDEKVGGMRKLFPEDEIEYFLAIRNQATFIPAVFAEQSDMTFQDFIRDTDPGHLRWSHVVERIQRADPRAKITVWSDEDTPLFWAQLIREIAGVDSTTRIKGGFDQIQEILTPEGMNSFVEYLRQKPPQTEGQKRRIISAFLERFARPEKAEYEFSVPGWTQDTVDHLTANYMDDIAKIGAMPGVRMIAA